MRQFFLTKIRLSYYFIIVFFIYVAVVSFIPTFKFEGGALTLFSVNSFLYGFYISPILAGQKARIEEIHKVVRAEANAIFAMALVDAKLPDKFQDNIDVMIMDYLKEMVDHRSKAAGEKEYEKMINYCVHYKGEYQAEVDKFLEKLIANQQNRTTFAMQMGNKVYSNEWMVTVILFTITLSFILMMDAGKGYVYKLLAALLCTGLTMLLIILAKMSTLTHKKAKQIWDPYHKLIDSHFYRID
ncbi:hypothetical protein HGB25_02025 [Candidatus Saccharibacteria bacterium]|nr:hypothetical protein [Candidatus Saccharibacteria bacterium]